MSALVLDIETCAWAPGVDRILAHPPEFRAPANYKDPEKIRAYIEEQRAGFVASVHERAALSPLTGRVAAFVVCESDDPNDCDILTLDDCYDGSEDALLRHLAEHLAATMQIVTFAGRTFDLPFLRVRFASYGVPLPQVLQPGPRYKTVPHLDLRDVLTDYDPRVTGTLDDWCWTICGEAAKRTPHPDRPGGAPITGADVPGLVEAGRWDVVREYARADGVATWRLWQRIKQVGWAS